MTTAASTMPSRADVEDFLFREARLLDDLMLNEWLSLFTPDGIYWIPIDDTVPVSHNAALVYDDSMRREERVHHLLNMPFPAQNPRSRTVHLVNNTMVGPAADNAIAVRSNQVIYEVRTGDFTQIGIGHVRPLVATVHHVLRRVDNELKIASKKILLIDRDMPQSNLTFII